LLPTFAGTGKPGAGLEKANVHLGSPQSLTVTGLPLWFSKVTVLPWTPFHPLLQTFFLSLIGLPFGLRHHGAAAQPETVTEAQLFGG
jgi:hypothetical protein